MGEGEVASFTFALAVPLAVHVDLGHFNQVAHLSRRDRETSSVPRSQAGPTPQRGPAPAGSTAKVGLGATSGRLWQSNQLIIDGGLIYFHLDN